MKALVIGEKTSQIKKFTQTLCGSVINKKHAKYIYEYRGSWTNKSNSSYEFIFLPLAGHITRIDTAKGYGWGECPPIKIVHDPNALRIINTAKYVTILRKLIKEVSELWLATDPDAEGDNIALEVVTILKTDIKKRNITIRRIWNSSLTDKEIKRSFENPIAWNNKLALGVQGRRMADAWLGFAGTREITRAARKVTKVKVVSVGRVQLPTLYLIVQRDIAHETFVSQDRWKLDVTLSKDAQNQFKASHITGYFTDHKVVQSLYNSLLPFEKTDKSNISDIKRKRKNQVPPVPLNTTSAVALLTRLMRVTAKKALDFMAELYNKGYLSYPRTENRRFKANFPHKDILSGLLGFSDFIPLIKQIKNSSSVRVNGKKMGEEDHDPIHPTGVVAGISSIDKQLTRAWTILSKYYISLFMDDYILDTDVVIIDIAKEQFKAEGKNIYQLGWKEAHDWEKRTLSTLPELQKGEQLLIHKFKVSKHPTQPPKRLTESNILMMMEQLKIGTKSSRPDILNKLVMRNYVSRQKRMIISTNWGRSLIASLAGIWPEVVTPVFTAHVEELMEKVAKDEQSFSTMYDTLRKEYLELHKKLIGNINAYQKLLKTLNLTTSDRPDPKTTQVLVDILSKQDVRIDEALIEI